jgi:hypothetical protein
LCLSSARGIAGVVKLWVRRLKIDALEDQRNPKLTNRNKNGLAGSYVLNPLYWTVDRLVRCSTLLRKERMEKGAWARQSTSSSLTRAEAVECAENAKMIVDGFKSLELFYRLRWVAPGGRTLSDE